MRLSTVVPAPPSGGAGPVTGPAAALAPYALVRLAAVPYPAPGPASAPYRATVDDLIRVRRQLVALAGPLTDALHDTVDTHPIRFHRRVVLPLRRAVHNGRSPGPALRDALGDLPARVPLLRTWLRLTDEQARALARLAADAPAALAAERAALAELCAADAVRRAIALIGGDLHHGVARVARAATDGRTRRTEPAALRYALRASAKTSPLSWFTHVAWGEWVTGDPGDGTWAAPVAHVRASRTLLARLLGAVRTAPDVRRTLAYRPAPGLRVADGVVRFRREIVLDEGDRVLAIGEEDAALAVTRPLTLLLAAAGPGSWTDLVSALAARLPGTPERARTAAAGFVDRTVDAGVLVPVDPVDPQDPDAVGAAARWLTGVGRTDAARLLDGIRSTERRFGTLPADDRAGAVTALRGTWRAAFAAAGAPWRDAPPLTEDVVIPGTVHIGRSHGRIAADSLTRLTVLAELFDPHLLTRRAVRNRFVSRYGSGGRCPDLAVFAGDVRAAWRQLGDNGAADPDVAEMLALRASVVADLHAGADPDEVCVPDSLLRRVDRDLPGWLRRRPTSYSFFAQPAGTGLVVNHVYSGWGRFTSRFLDAFGPHAPAAVAGHLRRVFGDRARLAQVRPVQGFNANVHPLLVPHEIGDTDQLTVVHDPDTDQVRLCHVPSGELVDVLYLGFLMQSMLPARLAALTGDLTTGPVDVGPLATRRDVSGCEHRARVRYRDVVLSRRTWLLPGPATARWRADLAAGPDPADAATRWIARLGLPTEVFIGSGLSPADRAADGVRIVDVPKPQYVDLANAVHLRCLAKTLARHPDGVRISEALPVPGPHNPGGRVVELVAETYRSEFTG